MKRFLCRNKSRRKYIGLGSFVCVAVLCCGCTGQWGRSRLSEPIQSVDTAMGTIISQTVYTDTTEIEEKNVTDAILQNIKDLEQNLLSWRLDTSELYRINENAGVQEGSVLSEEMTEILAECLEVSQASEGAFDITIGEVVRLWDIDSWAGMKDSSDYVMPSENDIQEGLAKTGYEKLGLQEKVLYLPGKMQLDLGAVGKGIALTKLQEYLEEQKVITGAVISVGGSILTYGQKPNGTTWKVGVMNPAETSANLGYLELNGQWCVSTSGDYERYVEVDGIRYHHIIDPDTGYPADSGLSSVTILTKDGLLSDALSTACFILGQEKGNRLAEQFHAEALFVDHEGNISMTDGMEQYFCLSK